MLLHPLHVVMSAASDLNDRMPDGGVEMILPNEMASIVIEEERSLLSTLTKNGVPITFAQDHLWGYDSRTIDYGTGLSYPAKAERARANPHVGLLFHRGQTEGIYMPHGTSQREELKKDRYSRSQRMQVLRMRTCRRPPTDGYGPDWKSMKIVRPLVALH